MRKLVEAEGKGEEFDVGIDSSIWNRLVISVRTIYRPARAKIKSFDPATKKAGLREMNRFAKIQESIAKEAETNAKILRDSGEAADAILNERVVDLARHNMASAIGWSSKSEQNKLNQKVFDNLQKVSKKERDENWRFVHCKVF